MLQQPHYITVEKTARYYLSGPLSNRYSHVCFVLHGYGQLVPYFIRHFEELGRDDILFIAPEGLHRYYLSGSKGRVGASWMTKEDRLNDIADYCRYLDQLYNHFSGKISEAQSIGVFAFSQGVATATRWISSTTNHLDYFINYAGVFPPDLDISQAVDAMSKMKIQMLVGNEDEFISEEKYQTHVAELKDRGFPVESFIFEGEHRLYKPVLKELFAKMLAS